MKKKVKFSDLKSGQKFRHKRKLYLRDDLKCPVQLSNGHIPSSSELPENDLVTPIKIKITVK
jgi:hypothetical protein